MPAWHVYILECADGTLYTGITTDIERRLSEHNSRIGAKYTSARLPVSLVYSEHADNRSAASKREHAIKQMTRAEKIALLS